jgi:hypothetical protein
LTEDVVKDTRSEGGRQLGRLNCTGSEDITHDHRRTHLVPFVDAARSSRPVRCRRCLHVGRHHRHSWVMVCLCRSDLGCDVVARPPWERCCRLPAHLGSAATSHPPRGPGSPPHARPKAPTSLARLIREPPPPWL